MDENTMIQIRPATLTDVPLLRELIPRSVRALSATYYTPTQIESAIRHIFGPDTQLIADGTYFVATSAETIVGCGGWSARRTLYGGDQMKPAEDPPLDPTRDAARIRAFFVDPAWARHGIGGQILDACINAARLRSFRRLELIATLPGEPLYAAFGFAPCERFEAPLPDGLTLPVVRMVRPVDVGDSRSRPVPSPYPS